MAVSKLLILFFLLPGCDSSQCMKDYYTAKKDSLLTIRALANTLADNYEFNKVTIRNTSAGLELMFHGGVRDNVTMYLHSSNLTLRSESVVDGCHTEALQRFRAMYQDNVLRQILQIFKTIEPKAIRITKGGVFIALGQPLKSPNPNLEGGILMTYQAESNIKRIVEEIDTNVYLYDGLVY